ncbi:MAG: GNAT family N-acetyltransferase [Candidatus Diapherotrites archaeon]|nr:GNAT family N-acetyltransferase [Candidatus Diapherotrites archaeon]
MDRIYTRIYAPKDIPFTAQICNDCWQTFYPPYIGKSAVARVVAARKKRPHKFVPNTKKNFCFVALLKGKIVGFAVGEVKNKKAHLIALYISPEHTGKGIGSHLIQRFFKQIKSQKPKKAFVETLVKNKRAIKLYASFGFKAVREKYFRTRGVKRRVVVMEKGF